MLEYKAGGDSKRVASKRWRDRMNTFTVYRVDYVKGIRIPIGMVEERRKKGRPGNLAGLLRLARNLFSTNPQEAFHIALDKRILQGAGRGIWFAS
jgi:hypothetical protein